eukprot:TRINITY_DN58003_c0_g1_i1.p1 TRINITY_DN58003_c0_g1~~TRINITY_DN58003_c0_g1_i1.p1  ORF type:complete len:139 (+),score=31.64 TRINITY_DN58003_c0_g1_i1:70-486(+)
MWRQLARRALASPAVACRRCAPRFPISPADSQLAITSRSQLSASSRCSGVVQRNFCAGAASSYEDGVAQKLKEALGATSCDVINRAGGCEGGNFAIKIESEQFRGKSKLQCQRMVQEVIREEIAKWHAVTIQTKVPES